MSRSSTASPAVWSKSPLDAVLGKDPLISEAMSRFRMAADWEAIARVRFIEDVKFANGDSDNGFQWPNTIRSARNGDAKPCLTMNVIRQHNLQISNDAKKNKSSIQFVGTGGGASQASANVIKDIVRKIEYQSNAQAAYSRARTYQVQGGLGWWRLFTDYAGPDTFDQEILIGQVWDPLSVYIDTGVQENTALDARWGFVFDTMPEDQLWEAYPELKLTEANVPLGIGLGDGSWVPKNHVVVCEYFRKIPKLDHLLSFVHLGVRKFVRESILPKSLLAPIRNDPETRRRAISTDEIEWKLIAGEEIIDHTIWPGKYIPLVRCIGEQSIVDGIMDYKGHTRWMKDAQRMFNYNASAQVEFVALQGKTPWVGPKKAIEELEGMWNSANLVNHSYLPYNHIDDEGNPIPPPVRTQPPGASSGYEAGMQTAFNQMMMTSGQYQNEMGQQGNERTGAAIGKRQNQSATAVFHFQDNYEEAMQATGKMILDLIPIIYDTNRVFQIQDEAGRDIELEIDPSAKRALQQQQAQDGTTIKNIFNPNIGTYDVAPQVGPAYGTRREETREALTLLLTQNPGLTSIVGDLLLASMDFEKATEAAQRLRRLVPKPALGEGPSQAEQQAMQQVQALQQALQEALDEAAQAKIKIAGKDEMRDIDSYEAETKRMGVLEKSLPIDPQGLEALIRQLIADALKGSLEPISEANQDNLNAEASTEGSENALAPMQGAPPPAGGQP